MSKCVRWFQETFGWARPGREVEVVRSDRTMRAAIAAFGRGQTFCVFWSGANHLQAKLASPALICELNGNEWPKIKQCLYRYMESRGGERSNAFA